jgi:hypothetical protein
MDHRNQSTDSNESVTVLSEGTAQQYMGSAPTPASPQPMLAVGGVKLKKGTMFSKPDRTQPRRARRPRRLSSASPEIRSATETSQPLPRRLT